MRFRITIVLMLALGGLTGVAVGSVLFVSASANVRNTLELLKKRAELTIAAVEQAVHEHVVPADHMLTEITSRLESGALDPANRAVLAANFTGAIAAAPQLGGGVLWQRDAPELWVRRLEDGSIRIRDVAAPPPENFAGFTADFAGQSQTLWDPPSFLDGQSYVVMRRSVLGEGGVVGVIGSGISLSAMSRFVADLATEDLTPFVLYGDDRVLGHPALLEPRYAGLIAPGKPLLSVAEIGDPVLAQFPAMPQRGSAERADFDARQVDLADGEIIVLSRTSLDYGPVPWRIGVYLPADSVNRQFQRLIGSIVVGLGMSVLAVAAALFLARRIARPITALSVAAEQIERLDLEAIAPLRGSVIRELDDQARSFNRMVQGLRWFQAYVPRRLVQKLMDEAGRPTRDVHEARLTVMFTDVVGFTALSETLPASAIVALLNAHFDMINTIVEAQEGTLDKFMGDAAMAFWGAPDPMPDHALRACRAALAIAEAVTAAAARAEGPSLRIKIGLHCGPLIVGNIGAQTRMNYTVIGDTVNVCARIETLAGDYTQGRPATVLVSGDVVAAVGDAFVFERIGDQHVKGRAQAVSVWRLVAAAAEA